MYDFCIYSIYLFLARNDELNSSVITNTHYQTRITVNLVKGLVCVFKFLDICMLLVFEGFCLVVCWLKSPDVVPVPLPASVGFFTSNSPAAGNGATFTKSHFSAFPI